MSWATKIGIGVAVLAAVAGGHVIDTQLPAVDNRPFVRTGGVGAPVHTAFANITVNGVYPARTLESYQGPVVTPGRWLVVDIGVIARGRPLATPGITLQDGRGRTFRTDPRSGYTWESAPTGLRWRAHVPFEVPEDALQGATLVFGRSALDVRRDDVAHIDLGIGPNEAKAFWDTTQTIEIPSTGLADS